MARPSAIRACCPPSPRSTPSALAIRRTRRGWRSPRVTSSRGSWPTRAAGVTSSLRCRGRGPMRGGRDGPVGVVTNQNHGCLNAEDDASTRAMEIAVDLVLLDDAIEVGVLRGGPAIHAQHAGRGIFGAGVNTP